MKKPPLYGRYLLDDDSLCQFIAALEDILDGARLLGSINLGWYPRKEVIAEILLDNYPRIYIDVLLC
jgi:hypothetical protein